jgi:hypothetical protein
MGIQIQEGSPCPICGKPLKNSQRLLNFTFIELKNPANDFLDDSAVHSKCLDDWKHCDLFIQTWNNKAVKQWQLVRNPRGKIYFADNPRVRPSFLKRLGNLLRAERKT